MEVSEIPAAAQTGLRLELAPVGHLSRVYANGQEISQFVERATVTAAVGELTRVRLDCVAINTIGKCTTVEGRLFPLDSDPARAVPLLQRLAAYAGHHPACNRTPCACGYAALRADVRAVLSKDTPE